MSKTREEAPFEPGDLGPDWVVVRTPWKGSACIWAAYATMVLMGALFITTVVLVFNFLELSRPLWLEVQQYECQLYTASVSMSPARDSEPYPREPLLHALDAVMAGNARVDTFQVPHYTPVLEVAVWGWPHGEPSSVKMATIPMGCFTDEPSARFVARGIENAINATSHEPFQCYVWKNSLENLQLEDVNDFYARGTFFEHFRFSTLFLVLCLYFMAAYVALYNDWWQRKLEQSFGFEGDDGHYHTYANVTDCTRNNCLGTYVGGFIARVVGVIFLWICFTVYIFFLTIYKTKLLLPPSLNSPCD